MIPETAPLSPQHTAWIDELRWNDEGLMPAISKDTQGHILMMAWMNRESLARTVASNQVTYWSRSRQKLWRKGEESGHTQRLLEIRTDCDLDVLLLTVEQAGGIACHTGRVSCFYHVLTNEGWRIDT